MGLAWGYHGFTMGLPWVYHGFTMGLAWGYHGFTMGLPWVYHGFSTPSTIFQATGNLYVFAERPRLICWQVPHQSAQEAPGGLRLEDWCC